MATSSSKRHASPKESPRLIKKVKQPETSRKGVAKKVTRRRVVSDTSSSDNDSSSSEAESSSADSLQEELVARASRPIARPREAVQSRPEPAPPRKPTPASSVATVGSAKSTQRSATSAVNRPSTTAATKSKAVTQAPHKAGPSGAARKSAPGHAIAGPAKAPRDVLANWDAPKQRRERPRVSGATPKDSTEPKFNALSVLGRYQKYGRENEKAPDINALTIIDPKTGKTIPPKTAVQTGATESRPSVYGRRTPPPQDRRRSLTPPSPNRPSALSRQPATQDTSRDTRPVCKYWLTSGCTRSAKDCNLIHPVSKNEINHSIDNKLATCHYWLQRGSCALGSSCKFAHADTGIYSSPQGFFSINLPSAYPQPPPPPDATIRHVSGSNSTPISASLKPPGQPACRDWLEGQCPLPADMCEWAHALPTEPYRGDINAVPKHQVYCYYWSTKGTCTRGRYCAFSHVDTGIQAGAPGAGSSGRTSIVPKTSAGGTLQQNSIVYDKAEISRQNSSVSKADEITRNLPPSKLTCYFWRTREGRCGKSDEECDYAHHHTGIWAAPPPGYRLSRDDGQQHIADAMTILTTAIRSGASTAEAPNLNAASNNGELQSGQLNEGLVGSPLQLQAPPMPPPGREDTLRRQSISTPAGSLATTITVFHANDPSPTQLQVKLELSELSVFGRLLGADPQLLVDRVILASDFRTLVWDDDLRDSESTVGSIVISDLTMGRSLVDLCKQHTIGLIATQSGKKSRMLIYPPSDDVWKFLDTGSNWKTESALRFRLFSEIPGIEELAPTSSPHLDNSSQKRSTVVLAGEELAKLESLRIQPVKDKLNQGARTIFLMFPPAHHAELEFYAQFFAGQNYRVYHSGVAGAWQYFCKTSDRKVVIVHPDIPMWQVPDLKKLLLTGMSIFSIGLNQLDPMDEPTFGCERLFPFATAALITDDVFIYHPEKALEILNGFIKIIKGKLEYKLVTRPGVKEWLLRLAEERLYESGRQDDRWLRLYEAMCRLCPYEDEDPFDRPNPLPDFNLVSLSPELFPNYEELWKKDEAAATEFLVEWFAGWTMENIGKLRKLHVLYEPKGGFRSIMDSARKWPVEDPTGWTKKYQHIWFQRPEDVFTKK